MTDARFQDPIVKGSGPHRAAGAAVPSTGPMEPSALSGSGFVPAHGNIDEAMTAIALAMDAATVVIPSTMPSIEEVRRPQNAFERVREELHGEIFASAARKVLSGVVFSGVQFVSAEELASLDRAPVGKSASAVPARPVSTEWLDLGAELGFIPVRDRLAVVVADGPRGEDQDVPDRIRRLWHALKARNFDRATVSVVATNMDRTTSGRVAKARAYVVKAPEGFGTLEADARLDALRRIFPAREPVAAEVEQTATRTVADKDVTKRYLKRNPRYSREDVAKWRERYSSPAGHD